MNRRDSIVGIMTRLDGPVLEYRQMQGSFFLSCEPSKRFSGSRNGYRGSFFKESFRALKLTTQTHLLPGLRTSGALNLLPLHVFMVWREQIV